MAFFLAFLRVAFFLVLRLAFLRVAFFLVLRLAFLRVAFFLAFLRVAFFLVARFFDTLRFAALRFAGAFFRFFEAGLLAMGSLRSG